MLNILEILSKEIEEQKRITKCNHKQIEEQYQKINQLAKENQMLRNDLFELSKEHFKK